MGSEHVDRVMQVDRSDMKGILRTKGRKPPNIPVIVVHLEDPPGSGLTACSGELMPDPPSRQYDTVPRYGCRACLKP